MSYAEIAALAVLGLALLTGLVAFGVGHRRWSWTSVAAAFLVILTATGYTYLVTRLLRHEWAWAQDRRAKLRELHRVRDALQPAAADGRLEPLADGTPLNRKSIADLAADRDRWQRALDRIDTWRGPQWSKAVFRPPRPGAEQPGDRFGSLVLPAAAPAAPAEDPAAAAPEAPPAPAAAAGNPFDPGDLVYVFDDKAAAEGGLYLGAFVVEEVAAGVGGETTLKVSISDQPDTYDLEAWKPAQYDSVTVFDELPADRWLAFSATPPPTERTDPEGPDAVAPQPHKRELEDVEALISDRERQTRFIEGFRRHALTASEATEPIEEDRWPEIRKAFEEGEALPGEYWAEIEFKERVDLDDEAIARLTALLGPGLSDAAARSFEAGTQAEVDLEKAFTLADAGDATIRKVFYRRPLVDAMTLVHGAVLPAGDPAKGVVAEGIAALMESLRREIKALETSRERLTASQGSLDGERQEVDGRIKALEDELAKWTRDLEAATALADGFAKRAEQAARDLEAAEQAIVELGDRYDREVGDALRGAPAGTPPGGEAAAPGGDAL